MALKNRLVVALDKRFKDARSADAFLTNEMGTTDLDTFSDADCKYLLEELGTKRKKSVPFKICKNCKQIFYKPENQSNGVWCARRYCSISCSARRPQQTCEFCKKKFLIRRIQKFCSKNCANRSRYA